VDDAQAGLTKGATMHVLRVEHEVPDFDAWKQTFDTDPIGRKDGGVRRYRILRAADDPNYVLIDLEFDSSGEAEAFHGKLRELWGRVDVMRNPTARVVEIVDSAEL
jgi:hypothetical protein